MDKPSTFTPGPWEIDRPYGEPGIFIQGANTQIICKLYDVVPAQWVGDRRSGIQGNALLISAAPELLKALELALDVLDNHVRHYLTSDTWNDIYCPSAVTEARAAIARAAGEPSIAKAKGGA